MKKISKFKKIKGDASFRQFYRNKENNSILVLSKKEKLKNLLIYDAINKIFIKNKILAPKLLSENYLNNYIEIQDFGDQTDNRGAAGPAASSTRGVFAAGYGTPANRNTIDFVTMASTGDSSEFGQLVTGRTGADGGMANGTRAIFAGGYNQSTDPAIFFSIIDTVNVQSKGEATKFGELTTLRARLANTSNSIRGLISGGRSPSPSSPINIIEFITMSTEGNAQDFGDLTNTIMSHAACSSSTRSVQCGGITPSNINTLQFVTISTTGNATDFGDMTVADGGNKGLAAVSDANGGLAQ